MKQKLQKTDFNNVKSSMLILLPITSVWSYRSYLIQIFIFFSTLISFCSVSLSDNQLYKITDDFMYKNRDIEYPISVFSPNDEIHINIRFIQLPKGNYSFQTEWYNPLGEIQTSSAFRFSLNRKSDYPLWSTLKLHNASHQKRMVTFSYARGYHIKLFGKWRVILYLNGEKVIKKCQDLPAHA